LFAAMALRSPTKTKASAFVPATDAQIDAEIATASGWTSAQSARYWHAVEQDKQRNAKLCATGAEERCAECVFGDEMNCAGVPAPGGAHAMSDAVELQIKAEQKQVKP
jgi:hypothetical protein